MVQTDPRPRVCRRPPRVSDGTTAPSLREAGLGRNNRGHPVLHSWAALRAGRALHAEGPMTSVAQSVSLFDRWLAAGGEVAVVGLGKSGVAATLLLRRMGIAVYASDTGSGPTFEAWA